MEKESENEMKDLERALVKLRERVKRSGLDYFQRLLACEAIAKLAGLLDLEEEYRHGKAS